MNALFIRSNNGQAILWPSEINRAALRELQNLIIERGERQGVDLNTPISCVQHGAPTINDLRLQLWPDYLPSMTAFLEHFGED